MAWSRLEVEAVVADYFHMLTMELAGQNYNKSAHRKALLQKLDQRTDAAVERKHQNISAILLELGLPYISGYKPLVNYQALLKEVVEARLDFDRSLDAAAEAACATPAVAPLTDDFSKLLVDAPKLKLEVKERDSAHEYFPNPRKRDYLAREARNASLGRAGEEFVLQYEHYRLWSAGKGKLAGKVEHVAQTRGDGMGFDILSFEDDGKERFIEVKTTAFGKETPFYLSQGELRFSRQSGDQFHLYRLFEFRKEPRLFELRGSVDRHCSLEPTTYVCRFS